MSIRSAIRHEIWEWLVPIRLSDLKDAWVIPALICCFARGIIHILTPDLGETFLLVPNYVWASVEILGPLSLLAWNSR